MTGLLAAVLLANQEPNVKITLTNIDFVTYKYLSMFVP